MADGSCAAWTVLGRHMLPRGLRLHCAEKAHAAVRVEAAWCTAADIQGKNAAFMGDTLLSIAHHTWASLQTRRPAVRPCRTPLQMLSDLKCAICWKKPKNAVMPAPNKDILRPNCKKDRETSVTWPSDAFGQSELVLLLVEAAHHRLLHIGGTCVSTCAVPDGSAQAFSCKAASQVSPMRKMPLIAGNKQLW